jgi:hypothetical protein
MRAGGGLTGVRVETATAGEIAKDRVDREFEEIRTRTQAQGEARRQS